LQNNVKKIVTLSNVPKLMYIPNNLCNS